MLNQILGEEPGVQLQLLQLQVRSEERKKPAKRVRCALSLDRSKAAPNGRTPEEGSWTCPRCRSHRCIRTNPGDPRGATYCCSVCGYTFSVSARTRLLRSATS